MHSSTADTTKRINEYIEICIQEMHDDNDRQNATLPLLPHLKAFLPIFRKLVLHLHAVKGHANFRDIINEIKLGHLDDDPELENYTKDEIQGLKDLTSYMGSKSFSCIHCQMAKIRAKKHRNPSGQLPPAFPEGPMATGYMDTSTVHSLSVQIKQDTH
jgi:hypothetical protein